MSNPRHEEGLELYALCAMNITSSLWIEACTVLWVRKTCFLLVLGDDGIPKTCSLLVLLDDEVDVALFHRNQLSRKALNLQTLSILVVSANTDIGIEEFSFGTFPPGTFQKLSRRPFTLQPDALDVGRIVASS
jgi:hypothetical protein